MKKNSSRAKQDRRFPVGQRVRGAMGEAAAVIERRRSSFTVRYADTGNVEDVYEVFWPKWKPAKYFWETDYERKRTEGGGGGVPEAPEPESGGGDAGAPGIQGPSADAPANDPARSVERPVEAAEGDS